MQKHIILFFLFILTFHSYSQQSINGTVSDSATGEKMPGVNVYFPELHKGTVTDVEGNYRLSGLPKGVFKVQFSFVGYESVIKTVYLDREVTVNLSMEEAVVESHEIVVTAMYASPQDETPVKVDQVSRDQMNKGGSISLAESLVQLPGISQVSTGSGIGKPVIRGLSANRVVVYSQGIRIENQQWGSEHGLGLSDMGIERVEVIKGPASLLYGSDAIGGALNLVDEKPANVGTVLGEFRLKAFSNTLGISNGIGFKGAGKTTRFSLRANSLSHADYRDASFNRITNTRFSENEIKASGGITLARVVSNITCNLVNSKLGIPMLTSNTDADRAMMEPWQQVQSTIFSSQNTIFLGKSKIKTNLGYLLNHREEYEEEENSPANPGKKKASLDMRLNTYNYDVKWQYEPSEKGEIVFGVQGMAQSNENSGQELLIPDAQVNDIGLIGLGHFHLKKMILQIGARFDHRAIDVYKTGNDFYDFQRTFRSFNGSAGGVFNLSDPWLFRYNFSSGFRAPSLPELTSKGIHHGTNRIELGNTNLKKEQNFQQDISSHYHSKHISIDVAAFYNLIKDYIFISPTQRIEEGYYVYNYLQENAFLYGGEFTIDVHPHPLDWLHVESSFSTVTGQLQSGNYLPLIPANKMQNSIVVEAPADDRFPETYFKLSLVSVSAQRDVGPEETTTPGYNLMNFGVGSKIKIRKQQGSFNFSINNLFNENYYDHLSRLKPYGINNMGRNFVLSLNIPIGIKT